jgi:hypothetical protein
MRAATLVPTIVLVPVVTAAQAPMATQAPSPELIFEVASIKPNNSGAANILRSDGCGCVGHCEHRGIDAEREGNRQDRSYGRGVTSGGPWRARRSSKSSSSPGRWLPQTSRRRKEQYNSRASLHDSYQSTFDVPRRIAVPGKLLDGRASAEPRGEVLVDRL